MSKAVAVIGGVAVLITGGSLGWVASRGAMDERLRDAESDAESARQQATALAVEVARLRDAVGVAEPGRADGQSPSPTPPRTLRSAVEEHTTRLAALEQSLPSAVSAAPVERGKQALADLQSNRDGTRVTAIRQSIQELVKTGDPMVPEIAAVLDSGLDTRYRDDRPLMQHLRGYVGVRMVLNEALREIGTPAARGALFESARKSGRLSDFRDVIYNAESTTDPVLIEGISALIPDMLRGLAATGIQGKDGEAIDLAWRVASWIQEHHPAGVIEPLEEALRNVPTDADFSALMGYRSLFWIRFLAVRCG